MIVSRLVYAAVAALAMIETANAQERQPVRGQLQAGAPLITTDGIEKLKLTAEQKEKFGKIEAEYKEKAKSAQDGAFAAIKDVPRDREKLKELLEKLQGGTKKLREESLTKVAAILTAEQKTVLEQVKDNQPRRPELGVRPGLPIIGGAGQIIPPAVQARLQLTDEQKKQIEAIQKEAETKALKVLTEEQRKQYEQFKKNPIRPGGVIRPVPPIPDPARLLEPNTPANPAAKKD